MHLIGRSAALHRPNSGSLKGGKRGGERLDVVWDEDEGDSKMQRGAPVTLVVQVYEVSPVFTHMQDTCERRIENKVTIKHSSRLLRENM